MFFDRGSASDYDAWEALGNPGWSFSDLLPYFKKSVTFTPPTPEVAAAYNYTWDIPGAYGGNGEIQVSFPPYQFPGQEPVWAAWKEMGIEKPREAANGNAIGAIIAPSSLDPVMRTRSYARTAHYEPFRNRSNYHLLTGHQVTEVLFNNGDNSTISRSSPLRAIGAQFIKTGTTLNKPLSVHARREVILAAGALWTPWLLQRSGIGPSPLLHQANIPVLHDLPGVGANFQDHPVGGGVWNWSLNPFSPKVEDLSSNQTFYNEAWREYVEEGTGPLTPARGSQAAFLPLRDVAGEEWEDVLFALRSQNSTPYLPASYTPTQHAGFAAQQALTNTLLSHPDSAAFEFLFGAAPLMQGVLMRPLSRGTVGINPLSPDDVPVVDYRTFSNPLDIQLATLLIPFIRRFNGLPAFSSLGAIELDPGPNTTSKQSIQSYLRGAFAPSLAHAAGTAAMMPLELGGVVDAELRVYGTEGLSVVDASVMPVLPATHLCATVYAVAERGADLVKRRTGWVG